MNLRRTALAVGTVLFATPALAGEQLTVEELVARSTGAVVVEVDLGSDISRPGVQVVRAVDGVPAGLTTGPEWQGVCAGRAADLERWLRSHPKWPEVALWKQALAVRRYQAVVFVRPSQRTGKVEPTCAMESMLMKHTNLHPGYEAYVGKLEAAFATKIKETR